MLTQRLAKIAPEERVEPPMVVRAEVDPHSPVSLRNLEESFSGGPHLYLNFCSQAGPVERLPRCLDGRAEYE